MRPTLRALLCISTAGQAALAQVSEDAALERLKRQLRDANPWLAARQARIDLALAKRAAAGLRAPLTLTGEIEEAPNFINVIGAGSARIDITREIVAPARRRAEQTLADRDVDRALVEREIAERAMEAVVDQLVAKAAAGAAIASRLASEDSVLRGAEEAVRARFAVADARYIDVLRLRTEQLRVETEVQRGRTDYRTARRQLARLATTADTSGIVSLIDAAIAGATANVLRGTLPPLPPLESLAAASGALRLAAVAVERAQSLRNVVVAESRAALTGSLGAQRFSGETTGRSLGITAGFSLSLPFTARRTNEARLLIADRELAVARAEQTTAATRLSMAIGVAGDRYEAARAQIAAYDAALLRGAREEREAALAAYRSGGMTLIELLDFERALAQAEVARIRGYADAADALLDVFTAALGGEDLEILAPRSGRASSHVTDRGGSQ